jgi:argininosuccinate lyase
MTLWGGRFADGPEDVLWSYTASTSDRRLLEVDIEGSIAHAAMLGTTGIIQGEEAKALNAGLVEILDEARSGGFEFHEGDEDVHSAVERRLIELIGDVGRMLHTGRSRNDQIALDLRLYLLRSADQRMEQLARFAGTLAELAENEAETVVPSYTHLQQAQAIPLGHHLLAYAWMAVRDRQRFADLKVRLSVSPLGAGASGGSSLPLDPEEVASALKLGGVFANSMDAVASRDLIAEYAWVCAQSMVHASRLAEELILWASQEFGWVTFSDRLTTGSSALPQKKNPDIAELARGKAAGTIGDLTALLTLQKGLPLAYNRDLQEDKEHVFRADDTLAATLEALAALLGSAEFHAPPPSPWVTALDLAEALVERGIPFRTAHQAVGNLVAGLLAGGKDLSEATTADLVAADPAFQAADLERIDPDDSVRRRVTPGGGSSESVRHQIEQLQTVLALETRQK